MSKGSGRRPASVSDAELAARWEKAFGKKEPKFTREEFIAFYGKDSGVTLETLGSWGRCPMPCECGDEMCRGWYMASPSGPYHYDDRKPDSVINRDTPDSEK